MTKRAAKFTRLQIEETERGATITVLTNGQKQLVVDIVNEEWSYPDEPVRYHYLINHRAVGSVMHRRADGTVRLAAAVLAKIALEDK